MTTKSRPASKVVENIKADLQSPCTTTSQTLNLLCVILGLDLDHAVKNPPATCSAVPQSTGTRQTKTRGKITGAPKRPPSKKAPPLQIHQDKIPVVPSLDTKARRALATEIFNTTLKTLSDASKQNYEKRGGSPTSNSKSKSSDRQDASPLKECSPNRQLNPNQDKLVQKDDLQLEITAECASVALDCLRQLETDINAESQIDLRLEQGGLVLLDKTIALELPKQAESQIRRLYEQYWKRRKPYERTTATPSSLKFAVEVESDKSAFKFATSLQSHWLRLAILSGSIYINEDFVHGMRPETPGSPPQVILQGHKLGHLDQDACGMQLRTISLALSKIYSASTEKTATSKPTSASALQLGSIALQIKVHSWKYLGHQPELEKELWTPFTRQVQRFLVSTKHSSARELLSSCVRSLQETLLGLGFNRELPSEVANISRQLLSGVHHHGDSNDLAQQLNDLKFDDSDQGLHLCLETTALYIDAFPKEMEQTEKSLERLRNSFEQQKSLGQSSLPAIFLNIARVRKRVLALSLSIERDATNGRASPAFLQLQIGCIRTVYSFVAFVLRCLQGCCPSPLRRATSAKSISSGENLLLTYAKTAEAVLLTEQLSVTRTAVLSDEAILALTRCLEIGELVRATNQSSTAPRSTLAFFEGAPMRVSSAFWSRFLWLTEHRGAAADRTKILQASIDAVQERSLSERQAAFLGLKYEKMATLLEESQSHTRALEMLRKALELPIEQGLLSDVVELYLLRPSDRIWSEKQSTFHMFGNNLASFAKLSLKTNEAGNNMLWLFDKNSLPALHRCVMIEHQIFSVLQGRIRLTKQQLKHAIDHIFELNHQLEQNQYQLGFVSRLLFLFEGNRTWDAKDFFAHEAMRSMIEKSNDRDASLDSASSILRHIVSTQWTFAMGELDEDRLASLVAGFKRKLEEIHDQTVLRSGFVNLDIFSAQLAALADFAAVLGNDHLQLDALTMFYTLQQATAVSDKLSEATSLIQIGILQNRLDNTTFAGRAFAQAEKMLVAFEDRPQVKASWTLSYAEYLFNVTNVEKCTKLLALAHDDRTSIENHSTSNSRVKIEIDTTLCQAAYLASRIALHNGHLRDSVLYARQAVRLSTNLWIGIEKTLTVPTESTHDDSSVTGLTHDLSNLTLSDRQLNTQNLQGAKFWRMISVHRQVLRHIATVFSHLGLYQDSLYYFQQASKVSEATGGRSVCSSSSSDLALIHANAAQKDKAQKLLSNDNVDGSSESLSTEQIRALLTRSEAYALLGEDDNAERCIQRLQDLHLCWLQLDPPRASTPKILKHVTPRKKANNAAAIQQRKQTPKSEATRSPAKHCNAPPALTMSQAEMQTRAVVLENALRQRRQLESKQKGVANLPRTLTMSQAPSAMVSSALLLLRCALDSLAIDPTNNTLAETALGMPVRYKSVRKSGQMSLLVDDSSISMPNPDRTLKASSTLTTASNFDASLLDGQELLRRAFEILQTIDENRRPLLSSSVVTLMYKARSQVTLMSSALAIPIEYSSLTVVLQSLIPKEVVQAREAHAIWAENFTASTDHVRQWPQVNREDSSRLIKSSASDFNELLRSLPASWAIVSIGLSHDHQELLLSKITAENSPFLMRVPLSRPDIEDTNYHEFTFDHAKNQLLEIIREAEESSHDDRGQGDRQNRSSWYAEREALDRRLKALLTNVENIWLGGFRGLLSSHYIDSSLLSRFGQSLSQSLDKHLPSRQKASKGTHRVDLHAHVLELFITLAFDETPELEDSITDLLYFVIDILQFNGEPNAYDEIDFDRILVDVLDALRAYHVAHSSTAKAHSTRHTILIIDKELEVFPWESLPCLNGRPVSRMPSLGAIKQRLDLIRAQSSITDALTIPADQGAYILNPSSDLKSTQSTFEGTFASQLPSFYSLINTPPAEDQFESCLTDYPLFLYFGHGSGAQYIHKRKIRRMQKCAVTWLMGCSSAKMVECGNFESYGMPGCYVHGGSAAVVGTLWDVTDRDLDRFAMRGLSLWGLVDGDEADAGSGKGQGRSKGRSGKGVKKGGAGKCEGADGFEFDRWKGTTKEERRGKVALDEAVSVAREACRLRYLNGAAVVVYGVPIVLH